jgi:8-oxo-dGTP diphosphatase
MRPAYGSGRGEEGIEISGDDVTIVVDVANVMGSRPDGWWRDRAGAAFRLHAELARLAASGRPVSLNGAGPVQPGFIMVFEGAARAAVSRICADGGKPEPAAGVRPGEVRVTQAPGSGDDAIVAVVRELAGHCYVVTADRGLRARCTAEGARILGPGWLLGLLGS